MLLQNPRKGHEVHDDLESSFWVLLYTSLHQFEHNQASTLSLDFFNELNEHGEDDNSEDCHSYGGLAKKGFLCQRLMKVKWKCAPLDTLVHQLGEFFDLYHSYHARRHTDFISTFNDMHNKIDQVNIVLNFFDSALASDGWSENDVLPDQYKPMTKKQEAQRLHDRKSRAFASAAQKKKSVGRLAPARSDALASVSTRSGVPGIRSSSRLAQQKNVQQVQARETRPSQLPISSRSTVKRGIEEVAVELSRLCSKRAKIAR